MDNRPFDPLTQVKTVILAAKGGFGLTFSLSRTDQGFSYAIERTRHNRYIEDHETISHGTMLGMGYNGILKMYELKDAENHKSYKLTMHPRWFTIMEEHCPWLGY